RIVATNKWRAFSIKQDRRWVPDQGARQHAQAEASIRSSYHRRCLAQKSRPVRAGADMHRSNPQSAMLKFARLNVVQLGGRLSASRNNGPGQTVIRPAILALTQF